MRIYHAMCYGLGTFFVIASISCQSNNTEATKPLQQATVNSAVSAEAKQIYEQRCVLCHGTHGMGDGAASAALNPKPRAYSDQAWQASVTDEHLHKIIIEGGAAVGKSALMPGNPDLKDKPGVVDDIVKIIRSYRK